MLPLGGMVSGGKNFNVVPAECSFTLDLRINPEEPEESVVARELMDRINEIIGRPPRFEMCPGLLETHFYAKRGVPAYAYGPGLLSVSHGADEYIEREHVQECGHIRADSNKRPGPVETGKKVGPSQTSPSTGRKPRRAHTISWKTRADEPLPVSRHRYLGV